jgi:nucleoside-diphosphate-sugar epimerase|tara:strand:+ start:3388 stop:4302 length:915 start_codon:yes stop_codon:yes gene_type:complete
MKLLLTGSSGFIGSHLTPDLQKNFELFHLKSDLLDHKKVQDEVASISPDIIVHLAARTEVEKSFYEQTSFSEVNYVGTVNLIEAASRVKNLKNFVFASTMEVYGWQPISDEIKMYNKPSTHVAFDENTQPNPNAPYAVAKYGCEKYLEYAHRCLGLPFTALRQTNCYGRKDNDFFVTEQIITQMLENPNEINLGYSEPYRNFIFIDDMMSVWQTVIQNHDKCNDGKIFTIGPDNPIKIKDYADMIANKIGWNGKINWNTKPARPGEIYWLNSNATLLEKTLGWSSKTSLDAGLDYTIDIWNKKI